MAKPASPPAKKPSVVLLHGADEYAISEKVREVLASLAGGQPLDDALETVDGAAESGAVVEQAVSRALSGLYTLSMFTPFKIVWLRSVNWLPEKAMSKTQTVKPHIEKLQAAIEKGLPEGAHLVITSERLAARSTFLKACEKEGEVHLLDLSEKPWELEREMCTRVAEDLKARGIRFDQDIPEIIFNRLGSDPRMINAEIEKLDLYLGDRRELEEADVVLMVAITRAFMPWDLADAIAERNLVKAFNILDQLVQQKVSEVAVMTSLEGRFRELLLYRECLDRGYASLSGSGRFAKVVWKDDHAHQLVNACFSKPKTPFAEGKGFDAARGFSAALLARAQQMTAETHEQMFQSALPKKLILELLVLRILGQDTTARAG